jgi:hypothetical protein
MPVFLILAILTAFISRTYASEQAKVFFTTGWKSEDQYGEWFRKDKQTFFLEMDEYVRVDWESALEDWKSRILIALNSSRSS